MGLRLTEIMNENRADVMSKWQRSKTFDWQESISELDRYVELKSKGNCCNLG